MRQSVLTARRIQRNRFGEHKTNATMDSRDLKTHGDLSDAGLLLMRQAMEELGLSARAYDKVRRVARTIADMEEAKTITEAHLAEAVQYRVLDRRF